MSLAHRHGRPGPVEDHLARRRVLRAGELRQAATAFLFELLTGKIRSRLIEFTPARNPGFRPA
ncbi:hypothetical protein [Lentzea sp. NPDC092896]|uniref:hypothetical protein n=1 Tax=Lentzea sp. NPDC092896 TaxID=3364127 RepID=UPI0038021415